MKTAIIFFLVGTLLVGAAPNQVNQTSTLVTSARYAESELLVKFAGGPESAAAVMAHTAVGSQAIRHFRACGWQQVRLPDGMSVLEGIAAYRALGDFVTAEPNYVRRLYATPDDPRFPSQWALQRISAPGAWNNTTGSTDVVVALIDTGVEYTHEDLAGNYNRVAQGTNWDDFTWSFRTTPANDDFANAQPIGGESGAIAGTSQNATQEPGEPDHANNGGGASVWFRWTAPSSDWMTFDTAGTKFNTLLAVYVGDNLETLTAIASNDDYPILTSSRLSFAPVAGATYWIAVDGKVFADINRDAPPMGSIVLTWYPTPPPTFLTVTAFAPGEGVWGTPVTLYGTNFTGVTNVLFDGVSAKFTTNANPLLTDLRMIAVVPLGAASGPMTIQTPHGDATSTIDFAAQSRVFYTVSPAGPALWVDWAGNGFVLEATESLSPPAWQPVTQAPTTVEGGARTVVVLPCNAPVQFFRWRSPLRAGESCGTRLFENPGFSNADLIAQRSGG